MNTGEKKLISFIGIFPLILNSILLLYLPDKIPMHYNMQGEADRIGSKFEILIFPIIIFIISIIGLAALKFFENKISPFKDNNEEEKKIKNMKVIAYIVIALNIVYNFMNIYIVFVIFKLLSAKSIGIFSYILIVLTLIICFILNKKSKKYKHRA